MVEASLEEILTCRACSKDFPNAWPHTIIDCVARCWDCSFKSMVITEKEYLKYCGSCFPGSRACIFDGEVMVYVGKHPEERRASKLREDVGYKQWRDEVFLRDNHTCQECGKRGGQLNAHHIRPYAKHHHLRTEITNGVTLCEKCHRLVHKMGAGEWLVL